MSLPCFGPACPPAFSAPSPVALLVTALQRRSRFPRAALHTPGTLTSNLLSSASFVCNALPFPVGEPFLIPSGESAFSYVDQHLKVKYKFPWNQKLPREGSSVCPSLSGLFCDQNRWASHILVAIDCCAQRRRPCSSADASSW